MPVIHILCNTTYEFISALCTTTRFHSNKLNDVKYMDTLQITDIQIDRRTKLLTDKITDVQNYRHAKLPTYQNYRRANLQTYKLQAAVYTVAQFNHNLPFVDNFRRR